MISLETATLILLFAPALLILVTVAWNVAAWPRIKKSGDSFEAEVSVLIPARNEEANIGDCLKSVISQDRTVAEILVYDDHSTDLTARIISDHEALDARVRLIAPRELPEGWCGKNFACHRLASEARTRWLLFIDADARLESKAVASLIAEARERRVSMLSAWPALEMESFWEKMLMPMLNFVVFTLFPAPLSFRREDPSLGLAHGACILAERDIYFKVGGHTAVRGEIFEDQRLARLWREKGERGLCLDGAGVVSVRMYDSLAKIFRGFQKNFFPAFRREVSFWGFLYLHATVLLAPMLLLFAWRVWPVAAAALAVLLMRLLLAGRFGHPLWAILFHPVAEAILIYVGLSSWWRCKSGRGVVWKGRGYQGAVNN
jgi:chlorobactene glucosyltransferase